jgi:hypothetical protein
VTHPPVGAWERFLPTDRPRAGSAGRTAPLGGAVTGAAVLLADLSTVMLIAALGYVAQVLFRIRCEMDCERFEVF